MKRGKMIIEALRVLPEEYVHDDTQWCSLENCVFAMNPELPPIRYTNGRWSPIDLIYMEKTPEVYLKKCPFCGKKPISTFCSGHSATSDSWDVVCSECGVTMNADTKDEAEKKWNRRDNAPA